jgi:hypothetical protein
MWRGRRVHETLSAESACLVEHFRNVNDAIACEKKLKGWRRGRKIALIEQRNPRWLDLSDDWEQQPKFYDYPWDMDEMIRDSSPATAGSE